MDFSAELDGLQQQVAHTKSAVQAAATESREELRQRIDQAQAEDRARQGTQRSAQGRDAQSKWAKVRADANDKMSEVKAHIDKRNRETDAQVAATDADWAENDALNAIDFAARTVDNARLAILNAIDARAYANTEAGGAR